MSGVRDKRKTHQPKIYVHAWLCKQANTCVVMFLSQYIWATRTPVTPLVIRDDAAPPGVTDVDAVWHGRSPGGNTVMLDQHPPGFSSQDSSGQECAELLRWSARVIEFGGGTEDGLYRDSEALAQVTDPVVSDLTNIHVSCWFSCRSYRGECDLSCKERYDRPKTGLWFSVSVTGTEGATMKQVCDRKNTLRAARWNKKKLQFR